MPDRANPPGSDSRSNSRGWQLTVVGEPVPLFNIPAADHPAFGSTVSENCLHKLNLQSLSNLLPHTHLKEGLQS
jgi:hypothetical protein